MNASLVLISVFLLSIVAGIEPVGANSNNTFNPQVKALRVDKSSSLSRAFEKISKLPDFHAMSKSELDGRFPEKLGNVKCVVYGNADPRQKVLEILKEIPKELLYSVQHTENDKITRIYIEESPNGEAQMLYAFVGKDGNDLVVSLFSGATLSVYQKEGDSLKEATFEEAEGYVTSYNAECPMAVGLTTEITSMSINHQYWTIRMKINTLGKGFVEGYEGDGAKDMAKTMIKGFNKEQICAIFNLNVGFKMVLTTENDETRTIVLEPSDIAEILNDTDATPEESLNIIIENSKKSCPLDMQNGMVMTDIELVDGILLTEITVDEERYSMAALDSSMATIRQNMINLIQQEQDMLTVEIANCLVKTNNGMGYVYIGNKSQHAVKLVFTSEELKAIMNKKVGNQN